MKRILTAIFLLTPVYLLVLASFDPWDLAIGTAISTALVLTFARPIATTAPAGRPRLLLRVVAFVPFAVAVARDVVVGTWTVATIALGLRPVVPSGIVEVPIENRTEDGVVVTALVSTLSPGAVLVDVDWTRRVMVFHVLGVDPAEFRQTQHELYRRYQRWVFP